MISFSRSHRILQATDWTRPALNPRRTLAQRMGLILYPTKRSNTRRACWASTRFMSMARAALTEFFTVLAVISLNSMRHLESISSFRIWARCQLMASPSISGSVAR